MTTCLFPLALALAAGFEPAPENEDWAGLDRELERLTAAFPQDESNVNFDIILRFSYAWSNDIQVPAPTSTHNLGGFLFDNLRLRFSGEVEGFGWFIETESSAGVFGTGAELILDAFASREFLDSVEHSFEVVAGQFRLPYAWSGLQFVEDLLFINRTTVGAITALRDQGVMVRGHYDNRVHAAAAVSNGADGAGDELRAAGRLTFVPLGEGLRNVEGARGASDEPYLALGAATIIDENLDSRPRVGFDAVFTMGPVAAHVEHFHQLNDPVLGNNANAQQFSATVSGLVHPKVELAARYQQLNDKARVSANPADIGRRLNTRQWQFGTNYYASDAVKVQLNVSTAQVSGPGRDTEIISLGTTMSF